MTETTTGTLRWPALEYREGRLHFEDTALEDVAAAHGTPCYVYSSRVLLGNYNAYDRAYNGRDHLVCYAMKANGNPELLRLLAARGAGVDIVSGGELLSATRAGIDPARIIFSGVAKSDAEIEAALSAGILMFNVESAEELDVIAEIAGRMKKVAPIAARVNPDVDPKTHPKISTGMRECKFGIAQEAVVGLYRKAHADPRLRVVGIQAHIGSQIVETVHHHDACRRLCDLYDALRAEGIAITHLSLGGGLGITYNREEPPAIETFVRDLTAVVGDRPVTLLIEPGRSIAGNAGVLLARVLYTKSNGEKNFVMVDAGMHTLIRPSMYGSYHHIVAATESNRPPVVVDVVGPICETGDVLGHGRTLPSPQRGDVLAILSAGAYGYAMASHYNEQPLPAEVLIEGARHRVIRPRETWQDLQ